MQTRHVYVLLKYFEFAHFRRLHVRMLCFPLDRSFNLLLEITCTSYLHPAHWPIYRFRLSWILWKQWFLWGPDLQYWGFVYKSVSIMQISCNSFEQKCTGFKKILFHVTEIWNQKKKVAKNQGGQCHFVLQRGRQDADRVLGVYSLLL